MLYLSELQIHFVQRKPQQNDFAGFLCVRQLSAADRLSGTGRDEAGVAPPRGAELFLPGLTRVRARGVHPAQAAERCLRQRHGKHRPQPQRRHRHGRRPELTTQQRHEQRQHHQP